MGSVFIGHFPGTSRVPEFLTTKFKRWRLLLVWISTLLCGVRTRKADGGRHRVHVWANKVVCV